MSARSWDTYDRLSEEHRGRATKRDTAHMRREAKHGNDLLDSAYKTGLKEGKREQRQKQRRSGVAAAGRRASRPVRRGASQGFTQALSAVQPNVAGGVKTLTLCLSVVALYLFLTSAQSVSGALGGVKRGFEWLGSPDKSIKFAR